MHDAWQLRAPSVPENGQFIAAKKASWVGSLSPPEMAGLRMVEPAGRLQQGAGGPPRPKEGMTMSTSLHDALTTRNPVEVPLYTPWDVARYLRVPVWAALALVGRGRPDPDWFFHHFCRRFPPFPVVDDLPDSAEPAERFSFRQLADLYV